MGILDTILDGQKSGEDRRRSYAEDIYIGNNRSTLRGTGWVPRKYYSRLLYSCLKLNALKLNTLMGTQSVTGPLKRSTVARPFSVQRNSDIRFMVQLFLMPRVLSKGLRHKLYAQYYWFGVVLYVALFAYKCPSIWFILYHTFTGTVFVHYEAFRAKVKSVILWGRQVLVKGTV